MEKAGHQKFYECVASEDLRPGDTIIRWGLGGDHINHLSLVIGIVPAGFNLITITVLRPPPMPPFEISQVSRDYLFTRLSRG